MPRRIVVRCADCGLGRGIEGVVPGRCPACGCNDVEPRAVFGARVLVLHATDDLRAELERARKEATS